MHPRRLWHLTPCTVHGEISDQQPTKCWAWENVLMWSIIMGIKAAERDMVPWTKNHEAEGTCKPKYIHPSIYDWLQWIFSYTLSIMSVLPFENQSSQPSHEMLIFCFACLKTQCSESLSNLLFHEAGMGGQTCFLQFLCFQQFLCSREQLSP